MNKPFENLTNKIDLAMDDTDEVRSFKDWWNKHGKQTLVTGLLAIAVLAGWNTWTHYQTATKTAQSSNYQAFLAASQAGQFGQVLTDARRFVRENAGNIYGQGTALLLAKSLMAEGKTQEALDELKNILPQIEDLAVKAQTQLTLVRYMLDSQTAEALTMAEGLQLPAAYVAELEYLKGLAYLKQEDKTKAAEAFRKAYQHPDLSSSLKPLVELYVNDLSGV